MPENDENPYESPASLSPPPLSRRKPVVPETVSRALTFSIFMQLIVLCFAALVLDGGQLLAWVEYGCAASWVLTTWLLVRHWKRWSPNDIALIKYGFILGTFVVMALWITLGSLFSK